MIIKSRSYLSKKEKKALLSSIDDFHIPDFLLSKGTQLERVVTNDYTLYLFDNKILFFDSDGTIFPTITFLREYNVSLPNVIVDTGAIKYIVNGADVMAPGVVYFDSSIHLDTIVCVKEEKAQSIIAVGKSLIDASSFDKTKKGKVVRVYHHLNDKIWKFKV